MPSHRAESPTPRRRTDRPDISERRQARAAADVQPGPDPRAAEYAAQVAGRHPVAVTPAPAASAPAAPPQYATLAPVGLAEETDDVEAHLVAFPGPRPAGRPAMPAAAEAYDLFGRAGLAPAPAAPAASVVKSGPAQPMTRAQLRASEGPLTSRSARRQAEKQAARPATQPKAARPGRPAVTKLHGRGLSLPQVGVAGALGLATIAAPLTGALSMAAPKTSSEPLPAVAAEAPVAAFPQVGTPEQSSVRSNALVRTLSDSASVPGTLAAPRSVVVTRASRGTERSVLPGCDGSIPVDANWTNGQIPTKSLCTLWDGKNMLRADAAVSLAKLNIAYKKRFGHDLCLTDSYRTLSEQRHLKAIKPGLAAVPGTSNHGWGVAIDMCDRVEDYGSATYRWMSDNAPAYGWENPDWALPGGPGPFEPWHWEFMPGEKVGPGSD